MNYLSALMSLIRALPEIIVLIENIDKRIKEQKLNNKIHEDISKINEAFKNEDAQALNKLFNS